MLPFSSRLKRASANEGCVGGSVTGAHDAAVTFQLSVDTVGPFAVGGLEGVGAVGDDMLEHPTTISSEATLKARFTIASPRGHRVSGD